MEAGKIYRSYLRLRQGNDFFKVGAEGKNVIHPMIVGNWKMHKTREESLAFLLDLLGPGGSLRENEKLDLQSAEIAKVVTGIAPTAVNIGHMEAFLFHRYKHSYGDQEKELLLGVQNIHWEEEGALTGEISAKQAKDAGAQFAIIGHPERRQYLKETDEMVSKKVSAALRAGLIAILCVGETMRDSYKEQTFAVVEEQLRMGLNLIGKIDTAKVVIAYQPPALAISSGSAVTPQEADKVPAFIRKVIEEKWGEEVALTLRILYGGNVRPDNISALMAMPNIDGALVGDASLNAEDFAKIVKFGLERG